MAVMYRCTIVWTGFQGAPGYTNLFATTTDPLQAGCDAFVTDVRTMLNTWRNRLSSSTTLTIQPAVSLIEATDGSLVDILTATTAGAAINGGQSSGIISTSGYVIDWLTSGAVFGRRRQGRSFLVPCAQNEIQGDGTPVPASVTQLQTACTTYIASTNSNPCVWVRPKTGAGAHAGQAVAIVAARVPELLAVLRSRRD